METVLKEKSIKSSIVPILKTPLREKPSKNIDEEAVKLACEFAEKHSRAFEVLSK
jgi:hypothetical protein